MDMALGLSMWLLLHISAGMCVRLCRAVCPYDSLCARKFSLFSMVVEQRHGVVVTHRANAQEESEGNRQNTDICVC